MFVNILLIILGFVLLIKGADFLVEGASQVAKRFHIPEIIIGMTIIAMGTSLPELLVSVKSAVEGLPDLSLGNVIGSNMLNLLLILGICSIIKKGGIPIEKQARVFDNPFNLAITFILLIICNMGTSILGISKLEGTFLLLIFVLYLLYMIIQAKRSSMHGNITNEYRRIPMWKALVYIILGAVGLKLGADLVVDNSVIIAQAIGISEKIIAITIVSLGTSLPELVSSITAVRKGENDLAIGNILGSNVFNILLILGVASVIHPIQYNTTYNFDILILFFSSILLMFFPYIGKKNKMTRVEGSIYVLIYIIYMIIQLGVR